MSQSRQPVVFDGRSFIRLLESQLGLYRQLGALASRQRKLVAKEDGEGLLAVLSSRQKLVNELVGINRQLSPVRSEWECLKASMTGSERSRAERLLKSVREELSRILESDQADSEALSSRRASVGSALASLQATRQAVSAYGASRGGAGSRFMDQTDEE